MNAQKRAIEAIRPGEILVIEARGDHAGTIGDILALRAQVRGAAGIVTDGAIRDSTALAGLDIPVYHAAVHPAVLGRRHVPWETGVTVACAGVTIQPGDLLVGDADGVIVLPAESPPRCWPRPASKNARRSSSPSGSPPARASTASSPSPRPAAEYEAWSAGSGAGPTQYRWQVPRHIPAKLEHFIGGAHAPSADGATFEVADPVTNQPYATVAAGGPDDVGRAVAAATHAFTEGPWPHLPARERARVLNRIADAIEARAQRIAELETFDTGLPVTQARGQAARAAENFRFFADMAVTLHEEAFRTGRTSSAT